MEKKWKLVSIATMANKAATMRGFKRGLGFVEVASELQWQHQTHDLEAVSAFPRNADVHVSAKVLSSAHARLTAAPGSRTLLRKWTPNSVKTGASLFELLRSLH